MKMMWFSLMSCIAVNPGCGKQRGNAATETCI